MFEGKWPRAMPDSSTVIAFVDVRVGSGCQGKLAGG